MEDTIQGEQNTPIENIPEPEEDYSRIQYSTKTEPKVPDELEYKITRNELENLIESVIRSAYPEINQFDFRNRFETALSDIKADGNTRVGGNHFNTVNVIEKLKQSYPKAKYPKVTKTCKPKGNNNTQPYDMEHPREYPPEIEPSTFRGLVTYALQLDSRNTDLITLKCKELKSKYGLTTDNKGRYNTNAVEEAYRTELSRIAEVQGKEPVLPPKIKITDEKQSITGAAAEVPPTPPTPAADPQKILADLQAKQVEKNLKEQSETVETPSAEVGLNKLDETLRKFYPGISDTAITDIEFHCKNANGNYDVSVLRSKADEYRVKDEKEAAVKKEARRKALAEETADTEPNPWNQEQKQPFEDSEEWEVHDPTYEYDKKYYPFGTVPSNAPWDDSAWRDKQDNLITRRNIITDSTLMVDSLNETYDGTERFYHSCKGHLMFDESTAPLKNRPYSQWYVRNPTAWIRDDMKVRRSGVNVAISFKAELNYWRKYRDDTNALHGTPKQIEETISAMQSHQKEINKASYIRNMILLAQTRHGMYANFRKESRKTLLSFKNGIYDEEANKVYFVGKDDKEIEHLIYEFPTRYIDREYKPTTNPENLPKLWLKHLDTIFTNNMDSELLQDEIIQRRDESVKYFRAYTGYGLKAGNPERIIGFFIGDTTNGKSWTVQLMQNIVGSDQYGIGTIAELCKSEENSPRPQFANSIGKCHIFMQEVTNTTDNGNTRYDKAISSAIIKALTGDKTTTQFRRMFEDGSENPILCLITACTNHMPVFDIVDDALLKRLVIIPFEHTFNDDEARDPDEYMAEMMKEADQIFSLMLDDLMEYVSRKKSGKSGLPPMPSFWNKRRIECMVPEIYLTYVEDNYSQPIKKGDNTDVKTIFEHFIEWCRKNKRMDEIRLAEGITKNEQGDNVFIAALTKSEKSTLKKAFILSGYKENPNHMYFKCHQLNDAEVSKLTADKIARGEKRKKALENEQYAREHLTNDLSQKGLDNYDTN